MLAPNGLPAAKPLKKYQTYQSLQLLAVSAGADQPGRAQMPDNTGEKQRSGQAGTALAIYSNSKSARPFDGKLPFSSWGGARNRASRTSDSLSPERATGLIEAAQFAAAIGLPFNRHLTIHWERAGVPDSRAAAATGRFLKQAGDWIGKRGGRIAWLWVRENDEGDGSKGSHVHILLHVPAGSKWTGWRLRRWLERITGKPYRAGTIQTARIGGTLRAAEMAPAVYQANLAAVVGYVLKGASRDAARALGLKRVEAGGRIIGKRCSTSQNIGFSKRNAIAKSTRGRQS